MSSSTLVQYTMNKTELLKLIVGNPEIPSPPTVVLRVLEKASDPDCSIGDLCHFIQIDPGLASRILSVVNSATFGLSGPVTSIQRALTVIGLNSARLLVLAISFPGVQSKMRQFDKALQQNYWKASVGGAIVARELSKRTHGRDPEADMSAALLRDLGELVLQQLFPDAYQKVMRETPENLIKGQCEIEERHCGLHHAEVSAFILENWRLPSDITDAIRHHHQPDRLDQAGTVQSRAYLLYFASRAAELLKYPDQPLVLQELLEVGKTHFGMGEEEVWEFLMPLSQKIADFAALLKVDIGEADDYQAILTRAREELVLLTVSTNVDRQRSVERRLEAESEAQHWKQEAVYDPLTRLFNRRFLETKLRECFDKSKTSACEFGMLFIDLDGFKPLNDRHGHLFGDLVLQKVGEVLNRQVRQGDIVARYGGDEFCILLTESTDQGLRALGDRVLQTINDLTITQGEANGKVGVSIGGVCCNRYSCWHGPEHFLAAADQAMYQAKSQGKNRFIVLTTSIQAQPIVK